MILYTTALLPVTLAAGILASAGRGYLWGAVVLGAAFLACAVVFAARPNPGAARRVFLFSVIYLPVLLGLMVFDR
jgi:heme o synthase